MPQSLRFDIFVFAHRESHWLGSCLFSVNCAIDFAISQGMSFTKTIIARQPDHATRTWLKEKAEGWSMVVLDDASLAGARSVACDLSDGADLVAFVDGSDLIGEAWFCQAARALGQSTGICRPQALMAFGQDIFSPEGYEFILQPEQPPTEPTRLHGNPYPSGFVATGDVLKAVKWPQKHEPFGWGQEDWWWNCLTIENGIPQHIVPEVAHYRRTSVRSDQVDKALRPGPVRGSGKTRPARGLR